ncbi:MAG: hypothetical protein EBR23_04115, partial [Planctomycetia bacterium]|nr:hypothetical protein [Planctomycetia bacterium]
MEWFEDFEDIETVATKPAARDRELVPEGERRFTIKRASWTEKKFEIALAADGEEFGWVFCNFPPDKRWGQWLIVSLAKALGYQAAPWRAAKPEDLLGRTVRARVYHRVGNSGNTFVNAGEFLPDPEQLLKQAGPAHTKARTADQK